MKNFVLGGLLISGIITIYTINIQNNIKELLEKQTEEIEKQKGEIKEMTDLIITVQTNKCIRSTNDFLALSIYDETLKNRALDVLVNEKEMNLLGQSISKFLEENKPEIKKSCKKQAVDLYNSFK